MKTGLDNNERLRRQPGSPSRIYKGLGGGMMTGMQQGKGGLPVGQSYGTQTQDSASGTQTYNAGTYTQGSNQVGGLGQKQPGQAGPMYQKPGTVQRQQQGPSYGSAGSFNTGRQESQLAGGQFANQGGWTGARAGTQPNRYNPAMQRPGDIGRGINQQDAGVAQSHYNSPVANQVGSAIEQMMKQRNRPPVQVGNGIQQYEHEANPMQPVRLSGAVSGTQGIAGNIGRGRQTLTQQGSGDGFATGGVEDSPTNEDGSAANRSWDTNNDGTIDSNEARARDTQLNDQARERFRNQPITIYGSKVDGSEDSTISTAAYAERYGLDIARLEDLYEKGFVFGVDDQGKPIYYKDKDGDGVWNSSKDGSPEAFDKETNNDYQNSIAENAVNNPPEEAPYTAPFKPPQLDENALRKNEAATRADYAKQQAQAIRGAMELNAYAGGGADQTAGLTADLQSKYGVATERDVASQRLEAQKQNMAAQLEAYRAEIARAIAEKNFEYARQLAEQSGQIQGNLIRLQDELSNKISGADVLGGLFGLGGTALGFGLSRAL